MPAAGLVKVSKRPINSSIAGYALRTCESGDGGLAGIGGG